MLKLLRFCAISHPIIPFSDLSLYDPFFARKLSLIAPCFDALVGAPCHFCLWVPLGGSSNYGCVFVSILAHFTTNQCPIFTHFFLAKLVFFFAIVLTCDPEYTQFMKLRCFWLWWIPTHRYQNAWKCTRKMGTQYQYPYTQYVYVLTHNQCPGTAQCPPPLPDRLVNKQNGPLFWEKSRKWVSFSAKMTLKKGYVLRLELHTLSNPNLSTHRLQWSWLKWNH